MATRTKVDIRLMIRRDMHSVLAIEEHSFEFPATEKEVLQCLQQRNFTGMVAEVNGNVAGYVIYGLHVNKIELVVFAIHPKYRRSGVGRAIIGRVVCKLNKRRSKLVAPVRESNLQAQLFLREMGFSCTQVLKGYYKECADDAYVFECSVGE